ncbi:MAG: hypothetical protein MK033_03880 [Candidatus Caenarcaniphilales bacterium]|nr:hypothetical protein [Candidatus Caenarcaniphilales bacterium]
MLFFEMMDITQIPVNPLRRVVVEFGKLLANQNSDLNKAICKALNIWLFSKISGMS